MIKKYFDEEGNEVEAFDLEQAQQLQSERDALAKEKEELMLEKKRLEEGSSNKDENFKKFREAYDKKEKEYDEAVKRLAEKDEYEKQSIKNSFITFFAGEDEESRKKLQEEYSLINIEESNPENIAKRMEKAARMSGLYKEQNTENPVFKGIWTGSAPIIKPTHKESEGENVINTEKGKSALQAMGIPIE